MKKLRNDKYTVFAKILFISLYQQFKRKTFDTKNMDDKFKNYDYVDYWYQEFKIGSTGRMHNRFGSYCSYAKWIRKIPGLFKIEAINKTYSNYKIIAPNEIIEKIKSDIFIYKLQYKKGN